MQLVFKHIKPGMDLILTLVFWTYFSAGYIIFFLPLYLWTSIFSKNRERSFQKLNHYFYKAFFAMVRFLTPGLSFQIDQKVVLLRSSIVICNHLSYLDPILLISLFEKQKTIVKSIFFRIPFFGWVLKQSGYIPSVADSKSAGIMLYQIEKLPDFLSEGGIFFVFPEGTRSRDGSIGKFDKGLFKIAHNIQAPIQVVGIQNTDRLFTPGKFLFNTCSPNTIKVNLIGEVFYNAQGKKAAVANVMEKVRIMLEANPTNQGETP